MLKKFIPAETITMVKSCMRNASLVDQKTVAALQRLRLRLVRRVSAGDSDIWMFWLTESLDCFYLTSKWYSFVLLCRCCCGSVCVCTCYPKKTDGSGMRDSYDSYFSSNVGCYTQDYQTYILRPVFETIYSEVPGNCWLWWADLFEAIRD